MQYEWDNGKATENLRKHGVDFADAIAALEDPNRLEEIDSRFEYGEGADSGYWSGSQRNPIRHRDAARPGHLQNHIGPEGYST